MFQTAYIMSLDELKLVCLKASLRKTFKCDLLSLEEKLTLVKRISTPQGNNQK